MDRFYKKNPEPFLRRSASLKPSVGNETFKKNYRAKTGHDSKYGKARLNARITDLGSEVEIGQTEDTRSPLVVMSARADKRFSEDLRVNEVDMNRAYKKNVSVDERTIQTLTRNLCYLKHQKTKMHLNTKDT